MGPETEQQGSHCRFLGQRDSAPFSCADVRRIRSAQPHSGPPRRQASRGGRTPERQPRRGQWNPHSAAPGCLGIRQPGPILPPPCSSQRCRRRPSRSCRPHRGLRGPRARTWKARSDRGPLRELFRPPLRYRRLAHPTLSLPLAPLLFGVSVDGRLDGCLDTAPERAAANVS